MNVGYTKYYIISFILCFVSTIFILCFCVQYVNSHNKIPRVLNEPQDSGQDEAANNSSDNDKNLLPKEFAMWILKNHIGYPTPKNVTVHSPFVGCSNDSYPPKDQVIEKFVIDLDQDPKERWRELITAKKDHLKKLVVYMEELMNTLLGKRIFSFINESLPQLAKTLPAPYYQEISGIAEAGNLSVMQATMYNIFYEVFTVCTSIITQDTNGTIHHGRNLDFGLFLGWDVHNHTWIVAEMLRPLVIQLEWKKNGSILFESVSYAGFIGVITGLKKDKFGFSLDERFSWNGGYIGLLEWIIFKDHDQKWVSFLVREVMETAETYEEAKSNLLTPRLLAPCYLILSGVYPGQGCIITRYRNDYNILELGSSKLDQASWFLVETNYDHWKEPPFYDDRRTPSIKCLSKAGQEKTGWELIYNVLSTKPVLNKLTTYTTLMDTKKGVMKTWLRNCPDPCWPW